MFRKYEKNKSSAYELTECTPKLVINRRTDLGPFQDRYKKQGRTYATKRARSSSPERRNVFQQNWEARHEMLQHRESESICKCGEPSDYQPVVVCASEWCHIGRFHVACVEDSPGDYAADSWYCETCREVYLPTGTVTEDEISGIDTTQGSIETGTEISSEEVEVEEYNVAGSDGLQSDPEVDATPPLTDDTGTDESDRMHLMLDGPVSPQTSAQSPAPMLFDGLDMDALTSEHITFADMAPFIRIENNHPNGLTMRHVAALEQWRNLCPTSKLFSPAENITAPTNIPNFSYP